LREFDDRTWAGVKKAAELRILLKKDRYRDVTTEINLINDRGSLSYHSKPCYKNFQAVKRSSSQGSEEPPKKKPETRQRSSIPKGDAKNLLKGMCLFCPKVRKKVSGKEERLSDCSTFAGCKEIIDAAPRSNNERFKGLLTVGDDLIAREAQYHKSCRREFFKEIDKHQQPQAVNNSSKNIHAQTFSSIASLVETDVIGSEQAMLVSSLFELYNEEFLSNGGTTDSIENYTQQAFRRKLQKHFGEKLVVSLIDYRKGNFVYSSQLSEADARATLENEKQRQYQIIRSAALHLRNTIKQMPTWRTPTPTSVENLKACSPHLPADLLLFFRTLLCGVRKPNSDAKDNVDRKVLAMSSDAVFNVSKGSVRPWKQTVLGLGLGTLTGSKLILRIMNRLGYSLSYDEVKALETEFAYSTEEGDNDAPDGIELKGDLGTGLAWDNYDVNMETIDGKDTLHATVGICYQNYVVERSEINDSVITTHSGRNRRRFDGREREIVPLHRQLSKAKFHLSPPGNQRELMAAVAQQMIDFYWLMLSQEVPQPLFVGFFSQFVNDFLPKQKITYMDPIPASPTRNDVVKETMKRSMKVAVETNQDYAIVTYDLAVALKAYSIQSLEAPLFDRLLIMLGNFHLEMAFYGAIGTYISESGAEYILTESGVLADGSLNGFIRGKYYSRCNRVHEIFAIVMERRLYQAFLKSLPQETQDEIATLMLRAPRDCSQIEMFSESEPELKQHMAQYESFFVQVMQGELGPTAQYWCTYVFMINRLHRDLMRAVRTNNIEQYITILPAVIDIFFCLNRPNYARWGVLFLEKLNSADPNIRTVLEKGAFSIRRTSNDFSRTAVDLCLEQTVNRDAASPMRGIVGFHYSENAIRRWCTTSTQRGMSVTELRRLTGLLSEEQSRIQLRESRILKDNQHIHALLDTVTETCDPFSAPASESECLLNIATGKGASPATEEYLLQSLSVGHEMQKNFRQECADDNTRLLKPIKRRKVRNFASENTKPKQHSKCNVIVNSQRDRFIRMLVVIAQKTNFDLKHVLSYPITDVPLSIAQPDGSLLKTEKSKLLKKLESMQDGFESLPHIDVSLIDGGLLIHSHLSAIGSITSLGNLARSLLLNVCSCAGLEIHVLFDKYQPASLKESERRLRGAKDEPFVISGSEQKPKQRCHQLLQNGIFKDQLAKFLLGEWQKDHYGAILGQRTLIASHGGNCVRLKYNQMDEMMTVESPVFLQGNHEEADTLLAFHAANVSGSVLVRASDTDVIVILLSMIGRHIQNGQTPGVVIMDCGTGNSRRYIDVTAIANALETKQRRLSTALAGLHAFTGCDFTSSFYRKGKIKPYEILENDTDCTFVEFFDKLSARDELSPETAEEYVCSLYGMKTIKHVDEARHAKLVQMTGRINKVRLISESLIFTT